MLPPIFLTPEIKLVLFLCFYTPVVYHNFPRPIMRPKTSTGLQLPLQPRLAVHTKEEHAWTLHVRCMSL